MPGTIGSLNAFDSWRGQFQAVTKPVEVFTRAGTAGTGVSVGAAHGRQASVETSFLGTLSDCTSHVSTANDLVGTVVSCTDAIGTTFANTAVLGVTANILRAKGHSTKTHVAMLSWELLPEATA